MHTDRLSKYEYHYKALAKEIRLRFAPVAVQTVLMKVFIDILIYAQPRPEFDKSEVWLY